MDNFETRREGELPENYISIFPVGTHELDVSAAFCDALNSESINFPVIVRDFEAMVPEKQADKIKKLFETFRATREGELFERYLRDPSRILHILTCPHHDFAPSWVREKRRLLERTLKASYLLRAEGAEKRGDRLVAEESRGNAASIGVPALNGEGMRLVIEGTVLKILEEYPELRPHYND